MSRYASARELLTHQFANQFACTRIVLLALNPYNVEAALSRHRRIAELVELRDRLECIYFDEGLQLADRLELHAAEARLAALLDGKPEPEPMTGAELMAELMLSLGKAVA